MTKSYAVKDCFRTIQGEGTHAGTPAVFLRLAGCNMWSGMDEDRARDSARNEAECPKWCDTDFVGGAKMTAEQIVELVLAKQGVMGAPILVVTGGEPMLQIDDDLLAALWPKTRVDQVCIETNGTVEPRFDLDRWCVGDRPAVWVTLSPKQPRSRLALGMAWVDELKLVYPAYDPADWEDFPGPKFIQPQALYSGRWFEHEHEAAAFVMKDGRWRLSLQQHKVINLP